MIKRRCARGSCRAKAWWREWGHPRFWCHRHAAEICADVRLVPIEAADPYCVEHV